MKKNYLRAVAAALAALIAAGVLSSCAKDDGLPNMPTIVTPLVAASDPFSGNFNPFYASSSGDLGVMEMTQLYLLSTARNGEIVYNGIEGEKLAYGSNSDGGDAYEYKGAANVKIEQRGDNTVYAITLKKGLLFSDGTEITADDLIFNYYVYLDPSYSGYSQLKSVNIAGLKSYLTQTTDEVYAKYEQYASDIFAAGEKHKWSTADAWPEKAQNTYWQTMKNAWIDDLGTIVAYCGALVNDYAEERLHTAPDIVSASEGYQIALSIVLWGYGEVNPETNILTTSVLEKEYDLGAGQFPSLEDFYNETYAAYEGDAAAYWSVEAVSETDVISACNAKFIPAAGAKDTAASSGGVPNISGIAKIDKYTAEVTTEGFDASAVYSICGIPIAPLHYYGDTAKYDYGKNMFGHDYGDLSAVKAKSGFPVGGGPYRFIKYENATVYLETNKNYYKGCPKLAGVQLTEIGEADRITAIQIGVADVAVISGTKAKLARVAEVNGGELNGEIITTAAVDDSSYGYIGINAELVKVGGDSKSEASVNLRKAIATVISAYRDEAVNSYYGGAKAVINYPVSNSSWAAPQPSGEGYEPAFAKDVNGGNLYPGDDMSAEQKNEAALQAAIGFLKAAGYTWSEASGSFTSAPYGAKMNYEVLIPANGIGEHPSFQIVNGLKNDFASIGIEIEINDIADANVLLDRLATGTVDIWAAARKTPNYPDMYDVYHSANIPGRDGTNLNYFHIDDAQLDGLITKARENSSQPYDKTAYKSCLDIVMGWACEIPVYQKQNLILFSAERIKLDTITPDITTYWSWMRDIEKLELAAPR